MTGREYVKELSNIFMEFDLWDEELDYTPDVTFSVPSKKGTTRKITFDMGREIMVKNETQIIDLKEDTKTKKTTKK